ENRLPEIFVFAILAEIALGRRFDAEPWAWIKIDDAGPRRRESKKTESDGDKPVKSPLSPFIRLLSPGPGDHGRASGA
ncbi:MAG: hypothetical protein ABGZ35_02025, partial [Planctomycetaceae bacterium]